MSLGNTSETELLNHYLVNLDVADIGDAAGLQNSVAAGNFHIALHTADPGEAGDQTTSEATFTSYARVAVARSAGGWTVSGSTADNAAAITFPSATGGSNVIMFWSMGVAASGASKIFLRGHCGIAPTIFTVLASNDTVTSFAHGMTTDNRVVFFTRPGGTLPAGVTDGIVYFILATGLTADAFTFSTTSGGAAVNITVDGSGVCARVNPITVTSGVVVQFGVGALDVVVD